MFNSASVELAHTSHPFAGPPFGPTDEEDSLDRVNGCLRKDKRNGVYWEGCIGYKYVDGGFYGPKMTFDGRIGKRFTWGER